MSLLFRGIVWFGLYTVLVVLPLAVALVVHPLSGQRPVAVDLAAAAGFIAFALIVLEFALVSRLRAASDPFGTDALMYFHRLMGLAAVAFLVAHPVLFAGHGLSAASFNPMAGGWNRSSGALAFWLVLLLVASSVWRKRLRLGYDRWRRVHAAAALIIVAAAIAHMLQAGTYTQVPLLAGLLLLYGVLFLALMFRYRVVRPLQLWSRPWRVVENRDEGADTRTLVLHGAERARFEFEPGQFAWLITGGTPFSAQQHPLSIASSAEKAGEGTVEFSIKALGDWSSTVPSLLGPGARLFVDGPYGAFSPDREPAQGFVLIAGGIGITPMRSMLLTMRDREDVRPVLLFFAAANWQRVMFRSELAALEREINLKTVYVFAAAPDDWEGERGFITRDVLARHLPRQYKRYQYFVCGPPPMMDSLETTLTEMGVPAARVQSERFDMV